MATEYDCATTCVPHAQYETLEQPKCASETAKKRWNVRGRPDDSMNITCIGTTSKLFCQHISYNSAPWQET